MVFYGTDAADTLTGTPGNDEIDGLDGDDVIDGGAGDDTLMSGRGQNTFRFGRNDGHDAIRAFYDENPDGTSSRFNTLEFKGDVLASDVTVSRNGSGMSLVLTLDSGASVTVSGFFLINDPWHAYNPLQRVRFADGTEWDVRALADRAMTGTAARDWLIGTTRDDTIDGKGGYDDLDGGEGNDTYLFGRGDGTDFLARCYDRAAYTGDDHGRLNTLRFKDGVKPSDVTAQRNGDQLVIKLSTGDTFTAVWFYVGDDPTNTYNPLQQAVFADGTVWDLATLSNLGLAGGTVHGGPIHGTRYADTIVGTAGRDVIDGLAGSDLIKASAGTDEIDGGSELDTVAYAGPRAAYAVSFNGAWFKVAARPESGATEGTTELRRVERLQFSDGGLALDIDGQAGQVAKILGAVFGPPAVADQRLAGTGLSLLAQGMSYEALAAAAVSYAGKATHPEIVDLLWHNITGTAMPAAERAYWIGLLDGGLSVGAVTVMAADSSQNAAHIDLIGLAATGLAYE
jgi:Ca2+-binding RTX toxin-like protein